MSLQSVQTVYVRVITSALRVLRSSLTAHYGEHWELKIEGNAKGYWSVKWQQNDQHDQKLAGESFSISPE